jgi:hypothetical protein
MAIIQSGASSDLLTVDSSFKAARVSVLPPNATGYFQLGSFTGSLSGTGVAANAPVFSMRWAPATGRIAVIRRIGIGFVQTVGWTAGAAHEYSLFVARGWTVSDSGGTAVTVAANSNKMRTSGDPSGFNTPSDIRVATTSTYTAGTRTLDTNPIATTIFSASQVAVASAIYPQQYNLIHDVNTGDHPIILDNNEGLVINNVTVFPAAGNARMFFNIEWFETTAY